ncbi:MAG: sugar ABC transporter substrate-binding protein [Xanthobacteraceae bacterium]|nr:sugar ABC transporter substrate-binding protein [Xanthobacteraceae bacterium]
MNLKIGCLSRSAIVRATAVVAIGVAGCGGSSSTASSPSGAGGGTQTSSAASGSSPAKKAKIAAFIVALANPYDTALSNAEKAEAAKKGASITLFDAKFNPSAQVSQCQDALASGSYNVFLLKAVVGPPLVPCARQAIAKGIKVIAVDDPLGPNYSLAPQVAGVSASILSLPTTNGKALAQMTISACAGKNPCNIAYYFGPPTFAFSAETRAMFKSIIAQHPNIKILDEASSMFESSVGTTLTQQLLTSHPNVNVITDDSDQGALGSVKALQAAGKHGIVLIGGGGSCPGAAAVKAGQIYGTSALYPASLGTMSVDDGIDALNGKPIAKPEQDVSYLTSLGPIITKGNVSQFHCEWGTATAAGSS